jgi:hypothetical protein
MLANQEVSLFKPLATRSCKSDVLRSWSLILMLHCDTSFVVDTLLSDLAASHVSSFNDVLF